MNLLEKTDKELEELLEQTECEVLIEQIKKEIQNRLEFYL